MKLDLTKESLNKVEKEMYRLGIRLREQEFTVRETLALIFCIQELLRLNMLELEENSSSN